MSLSDTTIIEEYIFSVLLDTKNFLKSLVKSRDLSEGRIKNFCYRRLLSFEFHLFTIDVLSQILLKSVINQ